MFVLGRESFGPFVRDVGAVAGLLATGLALWAVLRGWWRGSIGRRRDHYGRIARLGTGVNESFFENILGAPPAMRKSINGRVTTVADSPGDTSMSTAYVTRIALFMRRLGTEGDEPLEASEEEGATEISLGPDETSDLGLIETPVQLSELTWIDRYYFVQAITDPDGTVVAFAVTARVSRFRPTFSEPRPVSRLRTLLPEWLGGWKPLFQVRLNRTRLATLEHPDAVFAWLGFRRFTYVEAHWFGNPGSYQHFVFAFNDAGAGLWPRTDLIFPEGAGTFRYGTWAGPSDADSLEPLREFRQRSRFNTYAVIGPRFQLEDYPTSFGPDADEVRTVP